jgi:hypothetical protein
MYEQWHPLGVVGVISAFNFPVAVWAWNAMIAAVCGDSVLWRPSSETPLVAVAVQKIVNRVFDRHGLKGVFNLFVGPSRPVAESLIHDPRIPLVSFTGSTEGGRHVAEVIARRLGRSILELGGNNGIIVMDDANPDLVLRAVLFGAVGTAGQRCTTTRRLFLQRGIAPKVTEALVGAYGQVRLAIRSTSRPSWAADQPPRRRRYAGRAPSHPRGSRAAKSCSAAKRWRVLRQPTLVRAHPACRSSKRRSSRRFSNWSSSTNWTTRSAGTTTYRRASRPPCSPPT